MAAESWSAGSIRLTPSGHLHVLPGPAGAAPPDLARALHAFEENETAGLFELAARPISGGLPLDLSYWREFAGRALTARCHTPGATTALEPIPPLTEADSAFLVLSAPPMEGAEYLSAEVLGRLWTSLDEWIRGHADEDGGLEKFLAKRAPLWRQVGRVCFHLAENRKDPDYPFAFLATYAPRLSDSARVRFQPLSRALQELAGEGNRKALVRLLTPVQAAADKSDLIRDLLASNDIYHPLAWTPPEAYRFLQEVPLYEESGLLVRVPDWWARRPRPRVVVSIGNEKQNTLGPDAILDFQVGMAIGGERLGEDEWKALLAGGDGLAFLKGQWVEVDREKLSEALAHWKRVERDAGDRGISFAEGMRLLAGAPADLGDPDDETVRSWSFAQAGDWLKELLARLRSPEALSGSLPGRDLRAVLRPYQQTGVQWLRLLSQLGLGACLADDMGLGKTIQVIALLLLVRKESPGCSLIVLPASLLANWKAEIERFAPTLSARYLHPSMVAADAAAGPADLAGVDVMLTTYGMLLRQPWLEEVSWNAVILDEAQAIKNPGARQTRAVKRLRARARITLTGTPVENRLTDLWSLFDFLCPGLLGSGARFARYARALSGAGGDRFAPLRTLVAPYILRRMKTDRSVIADLPEKTEVPAWCGLTRAQAALYQRVVDRMTDELAGTDGIARRGVILSTLLRLKQVCNHPAQVRGDAQWAPELSGKFLRLGELCDEIASRQERVLVFTQFREATEPLASFLAGIFGRSGLVLHGGTPVKERQERVRAFQADDGPPFFVLSLKAGGTGLNLTAASHVIHFDRWWNPAVENQATDRAFRIGQEKNVLVHLFVCQGTVEEKIAALIEEKTAMAKGLLDAGGEALLTEMDDEQLMATVALDIDRARAGG